VKVAAYQAPLVACGSTDVALGLVRNRVAWCETEGIEILCCPEGMLGGLADYSPDPTKFAINTQNGELEAVLAPLASNRVTTIIGFTEIDGNGHLFNAAAIFHRGRVLGLYRKVYPAINKSVYQAGTELPIFRVGDLTFGVLICNDSNYIEPARIMSAQGATALFVPTNNGLPPSKADIVGVANNVDTARAIDNSVSVIRADAAGKAGNLVCYGSSAITDPDGTAQQYARVLTEDIIVAEIATEPRERRRGWDAGRNRAVMEKYVRLISQDLNCGPSE
jgi:predicted amidohydrolase